MIKMIAFFLVVNPLILWAQEPMTQSIVAILERVQ